MCGSSNLLLGHRIVMKCTRATLNSAPMAQKSLQFATATVGKMRDSFFGCPTTVVQFLFLFFCSAQPCSHLNCVFRMLVQWMDEPDETQVVRHIRVIFMVSSPHSGSEHLL